MFRRAALQMSNDVILVVEDKTELADLYSGWLSERYPVRVANDGPEALEEFDEDVEVVLLDRELPGMNGKAVLSMLRDRGADCQVAMVTAVEPEVDVVEMGFDAYVTKPVRDDELFELVDHLLHRRVYDENVRKLFAAISKQIALESEYTREELDENPQYQHLLAEIEKLREETADLAEQFDDDNFRTALSSLQ
jgi:DNA-binding response OmpR family regulator